MSVIALSLSAMILLGIFSQSALANFKYSKPGVTVISPVTDMVYEYNSEIPLVVKVEMYHSSIPNLGVEELAEVRFSIDGQPENSASIKNEVDSRGSMYGMYGYANATILGLSRGAHKLFIRGHTSLGNFSNQAVSFNRTIYFIVDSVFPVISVISPQHTTYNSNTVSVTFNSYRPLTWAGYSLDQKMVVDCIDGANLTYLQNGVHSLRVYGTDGGGNVYASQSIAFSVEGKGPPVITLDIEKMIYDRQFLPSDYKNMAYWHLVFHVNEPTSWTGCSLNGGANQTIEGNAYLHLAYGTYTIVVYAADLCGNKGASAPYTFTLGPGEAGSAYTSPSSTQNSALTQTPSPAGNSTSALPTETSETTFQESFPWQLIGAVLMAGAAMVAGGVLVHFKKRKRCGSE